MFELTKKSSNSNFEEKQTLIRVIVILKGFLSFNDNSVK